MIDLGVNIDHVATLRQQRHVSYPDPVRAALVAEEAGADLITLHLREDRRHIQDADVESLRGKLRTRMNLECAITAEMLEIACRIRPQDVCLVPEKRQELTTEGGLDVLGHFDDVKAAVSRLHDAGIRVSLFIDPQADQIEAAARAGATVIELHTGAYAEAVADGAQRSWRASGMRWRSGCGRACGSMRGTGCTMKTCSRSPPWTASPSSISAMPSSPNPCSAAWRRRCAR